jgi:hypothetical protein
MLGMSDMPDPLLRVAFRQEEESRGAEKKGWLLVTVTVLPVISFALLIGN